MEPITQFELITARLSEINPEALYADGFEDALIGIVTRCTMPSVALYDYDKCVQILMERDEMDREEAIEFLEFNTVGAWVGENTPCFATLGANLF